MNIIITGSIAYDYLMTYPGCFRDHILPDHLDSISLSFLVDNLVRQRGGVAPNIGYTMALLGDRPVIAGTVGEDFEEFRTWLEAKGVDTHLVKVIPGTYTASFFANTDRENNQISSFYTGAMAYAGTLSIKDLQPKPDLVVISPNDPAAMAQYVRECVELNIPYLYDPSQQLARVPAEQIREGTMSANCVFVNEYEFQLLQKHTGLDLDGILKIVRFLVITLGEDGSVIYADGQEYRVPVVPPERILDPTGVGDAFRGGFLRGYQLGFDWTTCGQMGSLAATYCLEQKGTQVHNYTVAQFIERFRKHFDDQGKLDALLQ